MVLAHFGLFMVRLLLPSGKVGNFFVAGEYSYGTGPATKNEALRSITAK